MAIPDYQSLMLPVLRFAAEGETNITECIESLASELGLTDDELSELLPSGKQTVFSNRVHWAKTYMAKAGLVEITRRAHFRITERGREVLAGNPSRVDNTTLAQFPEFVQWRERSQAGVRRKRVVTVTAETRAEEITPTERIEAAYQETLEEVRSEILERVLKLSPSFFEKLIVDLLVAMGYGGSRADAGKAIGKSGDAGIDGIIKEDPLGLEIVYIQAKRYQPDTSVGRPEVQAFSGSLDGVGATKGVFVATSSFSSGARDFAERIAKRIILIDGEELARLLIQHNVGVRLSNTFEIKKIDEDYFVGE